MKRLAIITIALFMTTWMVSKLTKIIPAESKPLLDGESYYCESDRAYYQDVILQDGEQITMAARKPKSRDEWQRLAEMYFEKRVKNMPNSSDCMKCHFVRCGRENNGEEGQEIK